MNRFTYIALHRFWLPIKCAVYRRPDTEINNSSFYVEYRFNKFLSQCVRGFRFTDYNAPMPCPGDE